ncbi:cache domain-containing protein [Leucobacter sp. W1478]|uniref:cache domain-containing protein n=1 Tax=Leucobacter sp. W1478 TaxID=3439065 RepID=UPI003F32AD65
MSNFPTTATLCATAVDAIDGILEGIAATIVDISERFSEARGSRFDARPIKQRELEELANELEPGCLEVLARPLPRIVAGIGLVWVGAEDASGMLWWRADSRHIARKHHIFNPESDSYYDYRNSAWYQGALSTDRLVLVGPYIDAWGTDDHALTASMRMWGPTGLLGVAAVDLDLQALTTVLEEVLSTLPDAVLLGTSDRVIASNMALLTPGLRLAPFLAKTERTIVARTPTALPDWELVTLAQSPR